VFKTNRVSPRRFSPESVTPLPEAPNHTANTILSSILDRGLELIDVVSNRVFTSSSEASMAIQLLSKAAVELGKPQAVRDLGMATSLGNTDYDPLNSVPEVAPVLVPVSAIALFNTRILISRILLSKAKPRPGEEVTDDPPALVTPFNLEKLRQHLALVRLARRALPEDVAVRQKHLEESVWEVAQARMRQQHELFKQLGMDSALRLKSNMLQLWMWNWHLKLTKRLTQEIKTVLKIEGQRKRRVNAAPTALLGPLLALLKPETLSLITILEVMHMTGTGGISDGMKTARALVQIGKAVEAEYKAEMCRLNNIQIPATGNIDHDYFSRSGYRDLHARRVASRKYMEDSEEWTSVWTQGLRVQVGSILMDSLMKVATVERTAVNKRTGRTVCVLSSPPCSCVKG
jgi:DNA-directed RNA polymerase